MDFNVSSEFAYYEPLRSDGYSCLYKAQRFGRWFVLKGLKPERKANPVYMAMLEKEFSSLVSLDHPNIVRTLGIETDPVAGRCIVMEYVEGRTLKQFIDEKPSASKRRKVALQLLDAMAYYHARQIVHRDIKPSNILITENGDNLKLIDFGLADTDDYAVLKEPAYTKGYAAPEQMSDGSTVDCRADIYAFGVILRQLFPHRYRAIASRCRNASPDCRYASASDVVRAIRRSDILSVCIPVAVGVVSLSLVALLLLPISREQTSSVLSANTIDTVQPVQPVYPADPMPPALQPIPSVGSAKPKAQLSVDKTVIGDLKTMLKSYADSLYHVWQASVAGGKFSSQAEAEMSRAFFHQLVIERQALLISRIETDDLDQYGAYWGILNSVPSDFLALTDNYMDTHPLPQPYDQYASSLVKALSDSAKNSSNRFRAIVQADNARRWKQYE